MNYLVVFVFGFILFGCSNEVKRSRTMVSHKVERFETPEAICYKWHNTYGSDLECFWKIGKDK